MYNKKIEIPEKTQEIPLPVACGTCSNKMVVHVKKYNVARCAKCYSNDLRKARGTALISACRRKKTTLPTQNDILSDLGIIQRGSKVSTSELARKCREHLSQNGGYGKVLVQKSETSLEPLASLISQRSQLGE